MVDYATDRTTNAAARDNAKPDIRKAVDEAISLFPFPGACFDSDNGTESVNDEPVDWLQQRDIERTRSRPYKKNDQATVESRNNHVVRKNARPTGATTPRSSATCPTGSGPGPTCCRCLCSMFFGGFCCFRGLEDGCWQVDGWS